jgi:teichuronic acid exporter
MNLRSQALAGLRWTVSVRLFSQIITWGITLLVIRILSPADYGLLAMATVFIAFLSMFSEIGLGAAVVQSSDVNLPLLRRTFGVLLIINLGLMAILFVTAPWIGEFYNEPQLTPIVRVLSLQFFLGGLSVIPDAQLQRRMEFRTRSLLDLSGAVAGSLTTLTMALSGAGVWSLVAGSMLGQTIKTIGTNYYSPFFHLPDFSIKGMQPLLRFGGHFTSVQVIWMFLSQVDVIICAKLLGTQALGFYSVAMQLASLPGQRISSLVNQVAFPTFSRIQEDIPKVRTSMLFGVRILSLVGFPILFCISAMAPEIIEVVLGDKWISSTFALQALALMIPFRLIGNFVGTVTQSVGRTDIILRNVLFSLVVIPSALFLGARGWGLTGLALGWLFASPLIFFQAMVSTAPVFGMSLRQLAASMIPSALASLLAYIAVALARNLLPSADHSFVRLVALLTVGMASYAGASHLLNRQGMREGLDLFRNIMVTRTR